MIRITLYSSNLKPLHSELALPIVSENHILGVLNLESHAPIDKEDVASFEIIARQLANCHP